MSIDRTVAVGGVTIGLLGTGIVVLWSDKRWLGWVFIALGFLIAILGIVWALAVHHTRKELESHPKAASIPASSITQNAAINPQFNIAPVFAPSFNQSQSPTQEQSQAIPEKEKVKSEIECTDCYFTEAYLSSWSRLVDHAVAGGQNELCQIAQADFHLKPIPGADPWIELRTKLVFWDKDAINRLKRVNDGMWREQGNFIQIPLRLSDTRRLVIALLRADMGFNSYEYAEQHIPRRRYTTEGVFTHTLAPKLEPLNVETFTVQVFLSGKYLDKVTLNQEFWFSVSLVEKKFSIKQIQSPRGIETDMKMQY